MKRSKPLSLSAGDKQIRVTSDPHDPPDLRLLAHSVAERAEKVRQLNKRLDKTPASAVEAPLEQKQAAPQKSSPDPGPAATPALEQTQTVAPQESSPDPGGPAAGPASLQTVPPAPAAGKQEQPPNAEPLSEQQMVRQMCAMVKLNARASGKAPLNPPEWVRHQHLEQVRLVVREAQKKRG